MSDLTDFLLARIAEEEADTRAFLNGLRNPDPWRDNLARGLRECEAKRRIVEVHHPHDHGGEHGDAVFCDECQWDHGDDSPRIDNQPVDGFGTHPCRTLTTLASVYADHPDYREEWRA